jgi:hypothetical protein
MARWCNLHSEIDASLYICALTSAGMPRTSKYPPRRPHSPRKPLLMLWKERGKRGERGKREEGEGEEEGMKEKE